MTTVAGVFASPRSAQRAAQALQYVGIANVNVLLPGSPAAAVNAVPVSDTEQPGVGAAGGEVLGADLGMAGGLGSAAVTLLVPGVGPVLAVGMAASALFGVGGAAAGAQLDAESTTGLPAGELFVYKDALHRGKSVLFVQAKDDEDAQRAQIALSAAGAETIDPAREQHWIGLRSAEREHYQSLGGDFEQDESEYREGFLAGMAQPEEGAPQERESSSDAGRLGYQRGHLWRRKNGASR